MGILLKSYKDPLKLEKRERDDDNNKNKKQ